MQFKNTEEPQEGSLPPQEAQDNRTHSRDLATTPRAHPRLRHRCPLGCTHSHSSTEGHHTHPGNNKPPQGTDNARPQPQSRPEGTVFVQHPESHHYHHHQYYHHHQGVTTSNIVSRGVSEWRVPPLHSQGVTGGCLPQPYVPVDFRRRAIKYMTTRLQVGVNIEEDSIREIEKRILTLEEQVYNSSLSQDEYITKLASRLATILQHIDKCRSPQSPVTLQSQQERVM